MWQYKNLTVTVWQGTRTIAVVAWFQSLRRRGKEVSDVYCECMHFNFQESCITNSISVTQCFMRLSISAV